MFFVTFSVAAASFQTESFNTEEIAKHMVFAKCDGDSWNSEAGSGKIDGMCPTANGEIPCQFAGLWWMDNNPLPDYVASFGKSNWRSKDSDGPNCKSDLTSTSTDGNEVCACSNEFLSPVFNDKIKVPCLGRMMVNLGRAGRVWSWDTGFMGQGLAWANYQVNSTYIFECGGTSVRNITICLISLDKPTDAPSRRRTTDLLSRQDADFLPKLKATSVPFGMTWKDDHQWNRNSQITSSYDYVYWLKRVTTCDGSHDAVNWDAFTSKGTAKVIANGTGIYGNPSGVDKRSRVGYVPSKQMVVL